MLSEAEKILAKHYNVSTNFTLYELIKSGKYPEFVEYPDDEILDMIESFAKNTLQKIRDKFGPVKINSGYRNPKLNKEVGGVGNSVHQYIVDEEAIGEASDIKPDLTSYTLEEVFHWIIDNHEMLGLKTAIIYRKKTLSNRNFLHIDTRSTRPSFVAMEKMAPGEYEFYERD